MNGFWMNGVARSKSLLYGIEPGDTTTFAGGAVVHACPCVGVASWLPARRALRLSPTIALRARLAGGSGARSAER